MRHRTRVSPRLIAALGLLAALAAVLAVNLTTADSQRSASSGRVLAATPAADRFPDLARAHSNRCDLAAAQLEQMPAHMRLQGSCCFPMDLARYGQQLRGLRPYRQSGLVPRDPYDVSVGLAKRLLRYRGIELGRRELATYRQATKLSSLGGPCCCPCWRRQAFKGQARYLIARGHFSAVRVAALWGLEEGCGGPAKT